MVDYFLKKGVKIISGGTETHLLTIDTKKSYNLSGKEVAEKLEKVGIICNKQIIPCDTEKPAITSGIRLGSPALTTRGLGFKEFREIAKIIALLLRNYRDTRTKGKVKKEINYLVRKFLS